MRSYIKTSLQRSAMALSLASLVVACGKDDKKKQVVVTQQGPLETWITDYEESDAGKMRVEYRANINSARFECKVAEKGASADFESCPSDGVSFDAKPGVEYTFSVKAIGTDGTESKVVTKTVMVKSDGDTTGEPQPTAPAQPTEGLLDGKISVAILGKAQIGQVVNQTTLELRFGIEGEQVDIDDMRFECRRDNDLAWLRCPNAEVYSFNSLIPGSTYTLRVRAYHRPTKSWAEEDSITFKVEQQQLTINGLEQLEQKNGAVTLTFDRTQIGGMNVFCKLGDSIEIDCSQGYALNLDDQRLPAGSHQLIVSVKDGSSIMYTRAVNFCARTCADDGRPPQPIIQNFLLGSFYNFIVPQGMHVTEYATTKTFNRQLSFLRVTPESDPTYIGNYSCDGLFDRRISASTPAGDVLDYCHTTPTDDIYKWLTDYRLANNHIEVATDVETAINNPSAAERIMINVFDRDYEYMRGRSRFEDLCLNRRGTITRTPYAIPFVQDFWNDPSRANRAEFWMCDVDLAGFGPNGLPTVEQWRVGAFFITQDGADLPLPDLTCFDYVSCPSNNPNLLEVVYMARPNDSNWRPENFARTAQERFLQHLFESQPN